MESFRFSTFALFLLYISAQIKRFSALSLDQIHLSLTQQQLRDVFAVSSHNEVPEYSLTRVRSRSKRDTDGNLRKQVSLSAFGKRHNLRLSKNRHLDADDFKVYFADTDQDGRSQYIRAEDVERSYVGDPYQDEESGAAVIVHHDPITDSILLDGTIGSELVIKPAPISLVRNLHLDHAELAPPDDEFFLDEDDSITEIGSSHEKLANREFRSELPRGNLSWSDDVILHKNRFPIDLHFIIKRSVKHSLSDYAIMEADALPVTTRDKEKHSRNKRSAPTTIYPEILIILDYDGYLLHEQNSNKIKKYIISFMNGVDLRYRSLTDPMIKISMAGMIISRKSDATPYLESNMVTSDSIDSEAALTDLGRYLFRERRLPTYDIAMVLTKHDLCRRSGRRSGKCARGTAGFAYVGGACVVNKRMRKVNSVALVEDTGGFSGIIVAAHELGHLLGNVHDGSSAPPYLGGPGAGRCAWEEGYIMSDLRHTEKGFRWSPCSLEEFDFFLNGKTARCLYNAPHERQRLGRFLPGNLLSLDAQCQRDRGTSACFKDDRVCAQLFCFDQRTGYCVSYRPAAEGSPCGDGKVCRDGSCVIGESSSAGLNAHYSYALNGYITSATEHKAVWSKPPSSNSVQSAASSRGWSKAVRQDRSTREARSTTEKSLLIPE